MSKRMTWPYPAELELAVREAAEVTGIPLGRVKAMIDEKIIVTEHLSQPLIGEIVRCIIHTHVDRVLEDAGE